MITKEQLLAAGKIKVKRIDDVPGFDAPLYIRRLSGDERDAWEIFLTSHANGDGKLKEGTKHVRATLVAVALCDENGARMFSSSAEDIKDLGAIDAVMLDFLYDAIRDDSGLSSKSGETIAKNSGDGQSDSSG